MTRSRESVIVTLLERYEELVDPMQVRDTPGEGSGLVLMPRTYTASVRELERLLAVMREDRTHPLIALPNTHKVSLRACWWHINEWYLRAQVTLASAPAQPKAPRKRRELRRDQVDAFGDALKVRRVRRDPAAREAIALVGVRWIAENWGLVSEPMLPNELLVAA